MEVSAGRDGIQHLLQAEQEAQAIVVQARKGANYINRTSIVGDMIRQFQLKWGTRVVASFSGADLTEI